MTTDTIPAADTTALQAESNSADLVTILNAFEPDGNPIPSRAETTAALRRLLAQITPPLLPAKTQALIDAATALLESLGHQPDISEKAQALAYACGAAEHALGEVAA